MTDPDRRFLRRLCDELAEHLAESRRQNEALEETLACMSALAAGDSARDLNTPVLWPDGYVVEHCEQVCTLTATNFRLLHVLVQSAGEWLSYNDLRRCISGWCDQTSDGTVRSAVNRLLEELLKNGLGSLAAKIERGRGNVRVLA